MDLFDKCYSDGGYFGQFRMSDDHFFTQPILEPTPGRNMVFNGKKVRVNKNKCFAVVEHLSKGDSFNVRTSELV